MDSDCFTPFVMETIREFCSEDQIGLKNIPNQLVKQHLVEGFTFNILCIGETGIGKSSLISSLFNIELKNDTPPSHKHPSLDLRSRTYLLREKGVYLYLTVTETIGYGDQINMEKNFEPIVNFVDSHLEKYFQEEFKIVRSFATFQDSRIHACLYFICPTGHNLKALDLLCLKNVHHKVNIIPIVAKADTLTKFELERFKENIVRELRREEIQIYDFPKDDEIVFDTCYTAPFGVVGSTDFVVIDGKMVRARRYPWGTVYIEDEDHSDFCTLREKLIHTNMVDLKEHTHTNHYERYRKQRLEQLGYCDLGEDGKPDDLKEMVQRNSERIRKRYISDEKELFQRFLDKAKQKQRELMDEEERTKNKYKELFLQAELEEKALKEENRLLDQEIFQYRKKKDFDKIDKCFLEYSVNFKF